jgi:hypothetical protein
MTNLIYESAWITEDGFEIKQGDLIKVQGEYGTRFKFQSLTRNADNTSVWVDCFEIFRGQVGAFRSFRIERVKRIPTRGKRAKRVI